VAESHELRSEYEGRINRVIDYIGAHLAERMTLGELAKVACFSPFHFHRIFSAMVGETLADYVKRLRLEKAAGILAVNPRVPITNVALDCGFSSSPVFARAFKERFGKTASEWRDALSKTEHEDRVLSPHSIPKTRFSLAWVGGLEEGRLKVSVELMPSFQVAYVRHFGLYGPTVRRAWATLFKWAGPRGLLRPEAKPIGVYHDDPMITPGESCRYDACIPVPPETRAEGQVGRTEIPSQTCGVAFFEGIEDELPKAYIDLYSRWLPGSGYQPGDVPAYDVYLNDPDADPEGKFRMKICVPVKPL